MTTDQPYTEPTSGERGGPSFDELVADTVQNAMTYFLHALADYRRENSILVRAIEHHGGIIQRGDFVLRNGQRSPIHVHFDHPPST